MNQRLKELTGWLNEHNHSFALITSTPNVFYLSGFYTNPHERLLALIVFQHDEPILVCPKMEISEAKNAGWHYEILGYDDTENPWELIKKSLQQRSIVGDTVAIEKSNLTYEKVEAIQTIFSNVSFTNVEDKLKNLRMIKTNNEINTLKEAAALADFGVEVGVNALENGKTEMDILAQIEYELKKKGVREMSFSTLVLSGKKTASPHGTPGLHTVKKGDFVLFDLGVVLDGYCSDITRTVIFGEASEQQIEIYETVLEAQRKAIEACKPGVKIGVIDQTARKIVSDASYGEYFIHRIGHGLGIEVHEFPSMTSENQNFLQEGMTFTVEPGIYMPTIGGVRIEDDLHITKEGVESLTNFPKELQIIK